MRLTIDLPETRHRPSFAPVPDRTARRSPEEQQILEVIATLAEQPWRGKELEFKARPERRHPAPQPRTITRRRARLRTTDVFQAIPEEVLAELMGADRRRFRSWGLYVPASQEAWLRALLANWPLVDRLRAMLNLGVRPHAIARALQKTPAALEKLCAEFGLQWPLDNE